MEISQFSCWRCRWGCSWARFLLVLALLCTYVQPSSASRSLTARSPSVNVTSSSAASASFPFAVFGYLPEYRQLRFNYEAFFQSGLTHLIFFSAEVDPVTLELSHVDDRLPVKAKWREIRTLADTYGVKVMLCIGGGGRSAGFSRLVGDVIGRRRFVHEVLRVVHERQLDGIDFNWEYPASRTEWLNFGQLLQELRAALDNAVFPSTTTTTATAAAAAATQNSDGVVRSSPPLITMALHPQPAVAHILRASRILPTLDYVHWMAYDHIVPEDGHSSVAYAATVLQDDYIGDLDDAIYNARVPHKGSTGVNAHSRGGRAAAGAAAERKPHEIDHRRKLCLGIPFYGRHREDMRVPPESYEHLWQFIKQWARKRHQSWVEGGAELRALSNYAGYDYNGYDDVRRKMRLARMSKIGGIMIWELGQDVPPGTSPMSLMTAVHEQLMDWAKRGKGNINRSVTEMHTMTLSGQRGENNTNRNTGSAESTDAKTTFGRQSVENATTRQTKDDTDEDL